MLSLNDERWATLRGGYKTPFDPRAQFLALRGGDTGAWSELWSNLYHQGDVGEASYASVPHLAEIYCASSEIDWNAHAFVGAIELARGDHNPPVPSWALSGMADGLSALATRAISDLERSDCPYVTRSAMGSIALHRGLRAQAKLLFEYTDDELEELLSER